MPKQLTPDPDTDLQVLVPIDGEKRDATPSYQHVQALLNQIARLELQLAQNQGDLESLDARQKRENQQAMNRQTFTGSSQPFSNFGTAKITLGRWYFRVPAGKAILLSGVSYIENQNQDPAGPLQLEVRFSSTSSDNATHVFESAFDYRELAELIRQGEPASDDVQITVSLLNPNNRTDIHAYSYSVMVDLI